MVTNTKPSLQLRVAPVETNRLSSSPPASASSSRRITSWGSALSDTGSVLSINDMTPLPSPSGSGGFSDPTSAAAAWVHRRQISTGSDSSSHSGPPSSFSHDSDAPRSADILNPPSRSNSLSSSTQRASRRYWVDASPTDDATDEDRLRHVRATSDSPQQSPVLAASMNSLPALPSLPFLDLSPVNFPAAESFHPSKRPVLPVIQTTSRESGPLPLHSSTISPWPSSPSTNLMSSLPTAEGEAPRLPFRHGARFLNLGPPSRLGTLEVESSQDGSRLGSTSPQKPTNTTSPRTVRLKPSSVTPTPSMDGVLGGDVLPPVQGEMLGSFVVEGILGKGSFSTVALGKWKGKGKQRPEDEDDCPPSGMMPDQAVALKLISRKSYDGNERMKISVVREVEVLKRIHHPSLVSLVHSFSTQLYTVLVLDYAPGGELFDYLATSHSMMTEPLVRRIFGELCRAVGWMHSIFLVHRDIKLENVLLTARPSPSSSSNGLEGLPNPLVKLTDFGLSRFVNPKDPLLSTRCGSEAYASPELIMGRKYDGRRTDAWALGVVLYALITGGMPFVEDADGRGRKGYLLKIAKADFKWPSATATTPTSPTRTAADPPSTAVTPAAIVDSTRLITAEVKSLVGKLLLRDHEKRAAVDDVWSMDWMQGEGRPEPVEGWVTEKNPEDAGALEEIWSRQEE